MGINDFIKNFSDQFTETEEGTFTAQTIFKDDIDEWDSLIALSIIAMVDDEYNIVIKGDDIRNSNTIEDLYKIVESRI
jgi:acyl carrier protein